MVAYGEGKKSHNLSGYNQELSFEASDHSFGYARKSGCPSTSRSEENVALVRDMFTHIPRKSTRQAARESGLAKEEVYLAKPRTMEQLEDRIRDVITNVPRNFL
jgi:hypothetical protein